ncbi:hypothetical protein RclHR1_09600007 [Rhizophagus clarus]|uniref:Uncharacterized protein n=1 Tax=Rhizophagus clarus TaxID=94130 RepID=A0A2Z6SIW1_9GLOM|nr:hypothetical protein RclHR1_09600007 [Rhizophagus clarus]
MDETPVSFDLFTNITVDELDVRSVSICTTASKPNDEIALLSDKEDENTSDEGYKTDTSKEKHETDGSDEEFGNNKSDEESENDESDEMKRINLMRVNMRKWRMMAIQIIMMNKEQITLMYGSSKMGGFNCIIIAN